MTDRPFVSVVIPALNCAPEVADCIAALRAQDYPADRFEILIVDNGSTDDTVTRLQGCDITALHRPERGRSKALNEGLKHARGAIICSTDISCRPDPQWLTEVVHSFEDPDVGCVAGEINLLKSHDNLAIQFQKRHNYMSPMNARLRTRPPFLPYADGANASFRREVFDLIGPFEESFFKGADVEICYRLILLTQYKISFNERAVVWEPGEPTLQALLGQRFRIGMSNILFRRRFPALFAMEKTRPDGRRLYWRTRGLLAALGAFPSALASLGNKAGRERLADAIILWLMGWVQAAGRLYGRYYLARHGIRITPVHSQYAREYTNGRADVTNRLTWLPIVARPDSSGN